MTASITQTKLSSETLNRIDRVAAILGQGDTNYQNQIANTLVGLATLGYQDAMLSIALHNFEPEHFPSDLKWSDSNGQIGSEVN